MPSRSHCSSDSPHAICNLSQGYLIDSDGSATSESRPTTPMLNQPEHSPSPLSASVEEITPRVGRCIITNDITNHRWYPKRPKDDQKFTLMRNSLGVGNYGSSTNQHHFMFVREDWDRLYDRGWWFLVPSMEILIALGQWSADAEDGRHKNRPSDITQIYGGKESFEYRLVPTQYMVDAGLKFPRSAEADSSKTTTHPEQDPHDYKTPRPLHLSIYPHLVVASNGNLFEQLQFPLFDLTLPGISLAISTVQYWLRPGFGNTSASLVRRTAGKRRRGSSSHSERLTKRVTVDWSSSGEVWRKEPDLEDSVSSGTGFMAERVILRAEAESSEPRSIEEWRSFEPSSPHSSSSTPTLQHYRKEPVFPPPNLDWRLWDQTWRDVVVRSRP